MLRTLERSLQRNTLDMVVLGASVPRAWFHGFINLVGISGGKDECIRIITQNHKTRNTKRNDDKHDRNGQ